MLKSISFKKLAVLTAGLAIVLSSCGLQNQASESSGSGKTKNFALSNGYCYDTVGELEVASKSAWSAAYAVENGSWIPTQEQIAIVMPVAPLLNSDGSWGGDDYYAWDKFLAGLNDGVPCPADTTFAESGSVPVVPLQSNGLPKDCYPQDYIDATIAGFEQQRDKPDATDAYKAEMQKGIDALKGTCVSK